ncbi:MAG: cation:proton antiporter, partial [Alphaproteobacteria bacterium]|nr:cation:proton antiporter [Alphaproteobacteria bacterium]
IVSTIVIMGIALLCGVNDSSALVIGSAVALSSTAIVIHVLSRQKRMSSATGRVSFAILLFQDMAVIPILFLVGVLGSPGGEPEVLNSLFAALLQAALAIGGIFVVGRLVMRPMFRLVTGTDSPELFVATTLLVIVGAAVIASAAGASMALGAFVAGLLIAETEYSRAIGAAIYPFKAVLLGIFFFSVGMEIDLFSVMSSPLPILAAVIGLIAVKAAIIIPSVRAFGFSYAAAIKTALLLGPAGEFAFVVIGFSISKGVVSAQDGGFVLIAVSLSMAAIPLLANIGNKIGSFIESRSGEPPANPAPIESIRAQAIIVGAGRVGRLACEMLSQHNIPYIAIDRNSVVVEARRQTNPHVYYGEAKDPAFLHQCGIETIKAVIITCNDARETDIVAKSVRTLRKDVTIIARAHDAIHAMHLYSLGVTVAVPETLEASLLLSEAALINLGIPTGYAIASIHEKRESFKKSLQSQAGREPRQALVGADVTHNIHSAN